MSPLRRYRLAVLLGLASSGVLAQPAPPSEGDGSGGQKPVGPEFEPLLPKEGFFEWSTWVGFGERVVERFGAALPDLILSILVLIIFLLLARLTTGILERVLQRSRVDPALGQVVVPLVRYTVLGLGLIMAAAQAGFQVGSLLAGVGIAGLAIGLAAQDTLGSVFAGLTILWDRPFRIGDRVTLGTYYGQVTRIGLRSTRIRTQDDLDVVLPNREVLTATIVNHTESPRLRVDLPISIAYREDTREARKVLLAAVAGHELLAEEPKPEVVVVELADSGVILHLRVWAADPHQEQRTRFACLELAKIALDEAGIEIPFPQRTLHWAQAPVPVRVDSAGGDGE